MNYHMKQICILLVSILLSGLSYAQSPEKMNYQAVIRDGSNEPVSEQEVRMQISILQGGPKGIIAYLELQTIITDMNGCVSLEIGSGGSHSRGNFRDIDWSKGPYFIETATNTRGSPKIINTSQLLSVPYAFYAKTSGNCTGVQGPQGVPGPKGDTGAQGIQGPTGPQGSPDTTSDIQTKRPLKTIGGISIEGSGGIALKTIDGESLTGFGDIGIGVSSLTGDGVDNTDPEKPELSFPNADEVDDLTTSNKFVTAAEKTQITTNESDIDAIEAEQITQNTAITANTAKNSEASGTLSGDMKYWNGSAWVVIPATQNEEATLQMIGGVPTWTGGTPPPSPELPFQHPRPPPILRTGEVLGLKGGIWMDRNLGASQVATSLTDAASYGDLYQWGRAADGHEKRTSNTTATQATSDTPGHGDFIINGDSTVIPYDYIRDFNSTVILPYDWRVPQNDDLWQGVNGINNPCPNGYRLPTSTEWFLELSIDNRKDDWRSSLNDDGTLASPLNLPLAGFRNSNGSFETGRLTNPICDPCGFYWSSDPFDKTVFVISFDGSSFKLKNFIFDERSRGYSVRCLRDNDPCGTLQPPPPLPGTGEVVNPVTGEIWMDRNLGASQVATSITDAGSYGDLYQWGRAADGHEKRTSNTTTTLSTIDTPLHGDFITSISTPYDWRVPQNDNLWQGVNGINNPCPNGYRLPTAAEWNVEMRTWRCDNAGEFASALKLPMAGRRGSNSGSISNVGSEGYYWSSTLASTNVGAYSQNVYFNSFNGLTSVPVIRRMFRSVGFSVRCLKD